MFLIFGKGNPKFYDNTMAYGYSTLNVGNLYSLGDQYYQAKPRV